MKIYPNPSRSTTYICIPAELKNGGKLTVTNRDGELICKQSFEKNQYQLIPLDLTNQPSGIYKVKLENELTSVCNDLLNLANMNYPVLI